MGLGLVQAEIIEQFFVHYQQIIEIQMLALRLQSILFFIRATPKPSPKPKEQKASTLPVQKKKDEVQVKDKYARLHKTGPELEVTKILSKNGLLTSQEIWRSFQNEIEEKKLRRQPITRYFTSLSSLKRTLGYMRENGKISSGGYDRKRRLFKGWKLNEERAFKYVHPQIIAQLEQFKKKSNQL